MESILAVTHNTRFHADEVMALAMLSVYYGKKGVNFNVKRLPHSNTVEEAEEYLAGEPYTYLIDTGRTYDGKKYFDHHQYKGGKSSAGLIYDYLVEQDPELFDIPVLAEVIKGIDDVDVGVNTGVVGDISHVISNMYLNEVTVDADFNLAYEMARTYIYNIVTRNEELKVNIDIIRRKGVVPGTSVVFLNEDITGWNRLIFGDDIKGIEAIVTTKRDKDEVAYVIKTVSREAGSYDKVGREIVDDDLLTFRHKAGFIGKTNSKVDMLTYIMKHFRI